MIFLKGYYVDGLSLIRGVFENSLQLWAIGKSLIGPKEIIGSLNEADSRDRSNIGVLRAIYRQYSKSDRLIWRSIVTENELLTANDKDALTEFKQLLHLSVHSSRTAVLNLYGNWTKGPYPIPRYPEHDERLESRSELF